MAKSQETRRLARVLKGPHSGAEMVLRTGRYVVGSSDACDIVLRDSQLAARHALLSVEEDGSATIEPMQGTITIGNGADGPVSIADFQPVRIGTTVFALGPTDSAWPEIAVPAEDAADADATDGDADDAASAGEIIQAGTPANKDAASAKPSGGGARKGRKPLHWGLTAALLALLVAAGIFIERRAQMRTSVDTDQPAAATTAEPRASLKDQVANALQGLAFKDALTVDVDPDAAGRVIVSGYVDTNDQRREVLAAVEPFRDQIRVQVWSEEVMRISIRQALGGLRVPLTIHSIDKGHVVLGGVDNGSMSQSTVRADIMRDVGGIEKLDLEIVRTADALQWLRQKLAVAGVPGDALQLSAEGATITARGSVDRATKTLVEGVARDFETAFGADLTLEDEVTVAAAVEPVGADDTETLAAFEAAQEAAERDQAGSHDPSQFDFTVRAISLGPPAFVTLGTAEKYLIGSRFPNGMVLDRIDADGIVLVDDGRRHLVKIEAQSGRVSAVHSVDDAADADTETNQQ